MERKRMRATQAGNVFSQWFKDWDEIEKETEEQMERIKANAREAVNQQRQPDKFPADPITGAILRDSGM